MNIAKRIGYKSALFLLPVIPLYFFWEWQNREVSLQFSDDVPSISKDEIYLTQFLKYDDQISQGFQPRADVPAWPLKRPLDWNADPFDDDNWQFQLHAWRIIDPILIKYLETDDKTYLHEAFDMALSWQRFYESQAESDFTWYDMSAGIRAMRLGYFISAVHRGDLVIDEESERILAAMAREHAERLQDDDFIADNNHGLFQIVGLDFLCSVIEKSRSCKDGREFASDKFDELFNNWFTSEGVHKEHSPSYHGFLLRALQRLDTSRFASEETSSILEAARKIQPWFVLPDGRVAPIGDSGNMGKPLDSVDDLRCLSKEACFALGDFTDSGYAIVRSDPRHPQQTSMLFVQGMAFSNDHKHADDLSFLLFEHGRMIFTDSGKYGYNRDRYRDYVTSAAAHNTISILGEQVQHDDVDFVGSALEPVRIKDESFVVEGEISRPGFFTQSRTIEYRPGEWLEIRDGIRVDQPRQFVSSLHLSHDLHPRMVDRGFDLELEDGKKIEARFQTPDCTIDEVRGQMEPVLGWESVGYLQMEPASVIRAICPKTDKDLIWTIDLGG